MVKQIVVVSGKGGTGKTVVTGALCSIAKSKVIVDADVDAADLFLLLNPIVKETHKFSGGNKAVISKQKCIQCGKCSANCRFAAINLSFEIDEVLCEGCGLCAKICPEKAINMSPSESGEWYVSETNYGLFVHAKIGIAEENSGKLVSLIKNRAQELALRDNCKWMIVDGPPGIGCPTIATLTNSHCAIVVTEPTMSGLHDAIRVIELAKNFRSQIKLLVNKYDLNCDMTDQIENYAKNNGIDFIGKIGFDEAVVDSIINKELLINNAKFQYKQNLAEILDKLIGN